MTLSTPLKASLRAAALLTVLGARLFAGADTGARSSEPACIPFFIFDSHPGEGAASIGVLDTVAGRILWREIIPGCSDQTPMLHWKGSELMASFTGPKDRKWSELRSAATGRLRWRVEDAAYTRVTSRGETVFLMNAIDGTHAIDAVTGRERWVQPPQGGFTTFRREGRAVVIVQGAAAHVARDPLSGGELWRRPVVDGELFQEHFGRLWVCSASTAVLSELDPESGREVRRKELEAPVVRINSAGRRLLLQAEDRLMAVRPDDMAVEWTRTGPDGLGYSWGDAFTIVIHLSTGKHALVDAATGRDVAVLPLPAHSGTSAFLGSGGIYSLSLTGGGAGGGPDLFLVNTRTGKTVWSGKGAEPFHTRVPDLLLLKRETELLRLDPQTGKARWTLPLATRVLDYRPSPHRVVMLTTHDALALDAQTGRELWRVELGRRVTAACFGWPSE